MAAEAANIRSAGVGPMIFTGGDVHLAFSKCMCDKKRAVDEIMEKRQAHHCMSFVLVWLVEIGLAVRGPVARRRDAERLLFLPSHVQRERDANASIIVLLISLIFCFSQVLKSVLCACRSEEHATEDIIYET